MPVIPALQWLRWEGGELEVGLAYTVESCVRGDGDATSLLSGGGDPKAPQWGLEATQKTLNTLI